MAREEVQLEALGAVGARTITVGISPVKITTASNRQTRSVLLRPKPGNPGSVWVGGSDMTVAGVKGYPLTQELALDINLATEALYIMGTDVLDAVYLIWLGDAEGQ